MDRFKPCDYEPDLAGPEEGDTSFDVEKIEKEIAQVRIRDRKTRRYRLKYEWGGGRRKLYDARRTALFTKLGFKCAICGSTAGLSVDHEEGRVWNVRALNMYARMKEYCDEYERGVKLRLLCRKHSSGYRPPKVCTDRRWQENGWHRRKQR